MTIDVHTHYLSPGLADGLRKRTEAPRIEQLDDGREHYLMPHGTLHCRTPITTWAHDLRAWTDSV